MVCGRSARISLNRGVGRVPIASIVMRRLHFGLLVLVCCLVTFEAAGAQGAYPQVVRMRYDAEEPKATASGCTMALMPSSILPCATWK